MSYLFEKINNFFSSTTEEELRQRTDNIIKVRDYLDNNHDNKLDREVLKVCLQRHKLLGGNSEGVRAFNRAFRVLDRSQYFRVSYSRMYRDSQYIIASKLYDTKPLEDFFPLPANLTIEESIVNIYEKFLKAQ